ncbi:MAG: TetR/AcrR family transcriptional regulator [Deltaproteobacteria bacterium]|nr:TetR/AcrR family transcriptional regulator [Deltaproteobacteria bacterium]
MPPPSATTRRGPAARSRRTPAATAPTAHRAGEREEKRDEIVRAARVLLLRDGYDATSMHRIAAAVEVAPNTLYWYFADKDAVLVAVLEGLLAESARQYVDRREDSLEALLTWAIELLDGMAALIATVHARAARAESVRVWHDGFHRIVEATIVEQLRARGLAVGRETEAALATVFVVEGMLAHHLPAAQRESLVAWMVSRLR